VEADSRPWGSGVLAAVSSLSSQVQAIGEKENNNNNNLQNNFA